MNKTGTLLRGVKPFLTKHQPEILLGMGIAGMIFSTIWGVKATVKAVDRIDILKEELGDDEKLGTKAIVKEVWPLYIPVAISMAASIPSLIYSNRISARRNAALIAAVTISENALYEYKEKAKEVVSKGNIQKIEEGIAKDRVDIRPTNDVMIIQGDGDSLFYEPLSDRYFRSNWNKISKSANKLYSNAIGDVSGVITLSDWFHELGLPPTSMSDSMGWTLADGPSGLIDISITSVLTSEDVPCGSIYYRKDPKTL